MWDINADSFLWDNWKVKSIIGKSSCGRVYLAEKEELGRVIHSAVRHITALDLKPHVGANVYSRPMNNISQDTYPLIRKFLGNVSLPNKFLNKEAFVTIFEHKFIENASGFDVFIRMELLSSLGMLLGTDIFDIAEIAKLGIDICNALEVLEYYGLTHGSIKNSNIFRVDNGRYKIGDFGLTNDIFYDSGSFSFMAPEAVRREVVGISADIYSLGMVLYRLLNNNRAPFIADGSMDAGKVSAASKMRLQGLDLPLPANADRQFSDIICKACAFYKEDRYSSVTDFRHALVSYRNTLLLGPNVSYRTDSHSMRRGNKVLDIWHINTDAEHQLNTSEKEQNQTIADLAIENEYFRPAVTDIEWWNTADKDFSDKELAALNAIQDMERQREAARRNSQALAVDKIELAAEDATDIAERIIASKPVFSDTAAAAGYLRAADSSTYSDGDGSVITEPTEPVERHPADVLERSDETEFERDSSAYTVEQIKSSEPEVHRTARRREQKAVKEPEVYSAADAAAHFAETGFATVDAVGNAARTDIPGADAIGTEAEAAQYGGTGYASDGAAGNAARTDIPGADAIGTEDESAQYGGTGYAVDAAGDQAYADTVILDITGTADTETQITETGLISDSAAYYAAYIETSTLNPDTYEGSDPVACLAATGFTVGGVVRGPGSETAAYNTYSVADTVASQIKDAEISRVESIDMAREFRQKSIDASIRVGKTQRIIKSLLKGKRYALIAAGFVALVGTTAAVIVYSGLFMQTFTPDSTIASSELNSSLNTTVPYASERINDKSAGESEQNSSVVSAISLNLEELHLRIAESQILYVDTIFLADFVSEDLKEQFMSEGLGIDKITWSSSDPSIVTVDTDGVVRGISVGTTVITAIFEDKSASCLVDVSEPVRTAQPSDNQKEPRVSDVQMSEHSVQPASSPPTRAINDTTVSNAQLTEVKPAENSNSTDMLSESDEALAELMTEPVPTASIELMTESAATAKTVNSIEVSSKTLNLSVGSSIKISAVVEFSGEGEEPALRWSSSNAATVSVNSSGVITAKTYGTAIVTAYCGGKQASCSVIIR